jgi:hypothetical protein
MLRSQETNRLVKKVKQKMKAEELEQFLDSFKLGKGFKWLVGLMALTPALFYVLYADRYPISSKRRTELFSSCIGFVSNVPLIMVIAPS